MLDDQSETDPSLPDPRVLELARSTLPAEKAILVTGGTGFVGKRLAQILSRAGHQVTVLGRSRYRAPDTANFVVGEITDAAQIDAIIRDHDLVVHSAAWTSPWGPLWKHRKINTLGTQNVVNACLRHSVERLVHVSSTAIFFEFRDLNIQDKSPLPTKFACAYAQSKAEAEQIVLQAIKDGLNSYIVRARAVFGPGDNALLPRLYRAASAGRLRQIGGGNNKCDLTYVDNLVAGLILALDPSKPSGLCTITNESPVVLWNVLHEVLKETCEDYQLRKPIPAWLALFAARISEWNHRLLRRRGEPTLTRYGVGLLSYEQLFQSQAAREQLGYSPLVSIEDAKSRTIQSLSCRIKPAAESGPQVSVRFFSTGYVEAPRWLAERGGGKQVTRFHATCALITHSEKGDILFDVGYGPHFWEATQRWPYRAYRHATKVQAEDNWSAKSWLERQGINVEDINLVLISHFHADHIGGIKDFHNADFISTEKAWCHVKGRTGIAAMKRAILPGLFPPSFDEKLHTIRDFGDPGLGPLPRCHDLFADGSIRLFELDGHADGQMGILLRTNENRLLFLTADVFWSHRELREGLKPTMAFRFVADNFQAACDTRRKLEELYRAFPQIEMISTHCPEFAEAQGFDAELAAVR